MSEDIPYAGAGITVLLVVSSISAGKFSGYTPKETTLNSSDH